MNNCFMCKGILEEKNASFMVDIESRYFIVENVPSQVCVQCGETFYSDEVLKQLDQILNVMKTLNNKVVIEDFTWSKKKDLNENFVEESKTFIMA